MGCDLGHETFDDMLEIVGRVAALHPLGHARQQVAYRAIGIALLLQPLTLEPVLAEDAQRLRHVADLVDLLVERRFGGIILRRQPGDDIAELDHRMQHAPAEDEVEYEQEQQPGDRQQGLRGGAPQLRRADRGVQRDIGALIDPILEARDAALNPVELTLIFGREQDLERGGAVTALAGRDRIGLLILQRIGPVQRFAQHGEFLGAGPRIADMHGAGLDRAELPRLALIGDEIGRIAADHILPRKPAQRRDILIDVRGRAIERLALGRRRPLALLRRGGSQHGRAGGEGERDGDAVGPVRDGSQTHGPANSRRRMRFR